MAKEFNEQCMELSKSCLKQLSAINELNLKTFNNLSKSSAMDSFLNAKKMEDVLEAQKKLMSEFNMATMNYTQQLFNIMLESSAEATKHFNCMASDLGHMASEATKSATKPFNKQER